MFNTIIKSVFGSSNDRYVKSLGKIVKQINDLEPQMQALTDSELQAQTVKFRCRILSISLGRKFRNFILP